MLDVFFFWLGWAKPITQTTLQTSSWKISVLFLWNTLRKKICFAQGWSFIWCHLQGTRIQLVSPPQVYNFCYMFIQLYTHQTPEWKKPCMMAYGSAVQLEQNTQIKLHQPTTGLKYL
jgi:hypothetical protein